MNPTCTVPGCEKLARSAKAEWCKMHYHRWYRHGSTDKVSHRSGVTASKGRRYLRVVAKGHPMAETDGRAYAHRVVLYDEIGPGIHKCHWCPALVEWLPKGEPNALVVDHVNGWGDDNRPENLVPCCISCNTARGLQARSAALRGAGWWSHNDTVAGLKRGGRREPIDAS